jgi:REP element-mobilizing transposase RayT
MANRGHTFAIDEYYHCYNRGTDKRNIFIDKQDFSYFLKSLVAYNSIVAMGKLRLYEKKVADKKLVEIISYCLLPNHYHLVLRESTENGISEFIKRVGGGYTMYFNEKYERNGVLFQGSFKSKHIEIDQDLRQVIAYVTYNNVVHNIDNTDLYRSWLNTTSDIMRGGTSHLVATKNTMIEVASIIKKSRLSFDS